MDVAPHTVEWFPKAFTPGDMDGSGAIKLLGTSRLSSEEILVRETAQNSWDARVPNQELRYSLHLRTLSQDQLSLLRDVVFRDGFERLGLGKSLQNPSLRVLEVSDRGTCGLNGPVRNDRVIPEGQPTNFIDLILNVGAPPDTTAGGGTYGFGKTVTYSASHSGTVLFWSRANEGGRIESRLIGSGIGNGFADGGLRYTGRHWWGRLAGSDHSRVEPIVGELADDFGQRLFSNGFRDGETGTSLLIIDPDIGDDNVVSQVEGDLPVNFVYRLRDAILMHLWPKLVKDPSIKSMSIELWLEEQRIPIPDPKDVAFLSPFVSSLIAVRQVQAGLRSCGKDLFTSTSQIDCLRPKKALGTLGLTREMMSPSTYKFIDPVEAAHHICLMRHEAELVVEYIKCNELTVAGYQWGAVFKPLPELDAVFAKSEPPTHDAWHKNQLVRPESTYVNQALNKAKKAANSSVGVDQNRGVDPEDHYLSTAGLATQLASFVESSKGNRAAVRGSRRVAKGSRHKKPSPVIVSQREISREGTERTIALEIQLPAKSIGPARVHAEAVVGIEGGAMRESDDVRIRGWTLNLNEGPVQRDAWTALDPDEAKWLVVTSKGQVTIDVNLKADWL